MADPAPILLAVGTEADGDDENEIGGDISDPVDTNDDNNVSIFSDVSGFSFPEGKSESTTTTSVKSKSTDGKTSSRMLRFPEILELLEEASEDADLKGKKRVDQPKLDFTGLSKLMESELSTSPLDVLEIFETFEKELSTQKSQITKLQCERSKLSVELEERKVQEKRENAKHLREAKSFEDRISSLENNLKASLSQRNELKAKETEYLQHVGNLEHQIRELRRNPPGINRDPKNALPKISIRGKVKDQFNEEEKKLQEYLEARVAELGNRVKEYEAKEEMLLGQKLKLDSENAYVMEQLSSQTTLIDSLKEEVTSAKAKETELMKEKGLADFRIRELQQELVLSKSAKPETGTGKGNPKIMDELNFLKNQVNTLKLNLKNVESSRSCLHQKDLQNQKNLRRLQTQVRTLQRILYHKDPTSLPPALNILDSGKGKKDRSSDIKSDREWVLEMKVSELENQLKLRTSPTQVTVDPPPKLERGAGDGDQTAWSQEKLIAELRGRLVSQMQLVNFLKENLIVAKSKESDWGKEKELLEFRIRELNEELTLAKTLGKPENQVLADLTETVQSLNSRYVYREKELDNLIRRLSLKTMTSASACPTSHYPFLPIPGGLPTDIYSNRQVPLEYLLGIETNNANSLGTSGRKDFGILSPNTTVQLVRGSLDEFLLLN